MKWSNSNAKKYTIYFQQTIFLQIIILSAYKLYIPYCLYNCMYRIETHSYGKCR